ncbi:MAG TPA: zinc ribbon domain-containing protein [Chthoniobacterales bacterium]
MTTLTAKLICPECRHENEAERIYCHDCGARLDRSVLTRTKSKEPDAKETHRRLQNMFDPRRAKLRKTFFETAKLLLGALAIAALVQMLRSPDLPESKTQAGDLTPQINLDLGNAAMDPRVPPLRYSDEQVNIYLASIVKSRKSLTNKYLPVERVFVSFGEGVSHVIVQRSLFGFPICTSVTATPQLRDGAIGAHLTGGTIGRLSLHPALLQHAGFLFADVRKELEREEKPIAKLGAIELHPQQIVIARAPQT